MSDKKCNWSVTMECVVKKHVYLEGCTEEQARDNPWEFASDEREIEQVDWKIINVKEDK